MSLPTHRIQYLVATVAALGLVLPVIPAIALADPTPADAPGAAAGPTVPAPGREGSQVLLVQVGSGVLAAAVTVPMSMAVGSWLGGLSGDNLAAVPGLLIAALLPPAAVAASAWLTGNWGGTERFRLAPAIWVTAGAGVAALVAAGFLGLNANEPGQVALYTAAQSALLPAAAVTTLQWTAISPAGAPPAGEPRPVQVVSVPVIRLAF